MKTSLALSLLILAATSALAAGSPNLTGEWTVHNNIAGSIDGNKVTGKYESEYNGTPLTLTYTAILDDSGKIAGSVDVAPFSLTGDFTATPAKQARK